ncbi:unnamed protein product [Parnassius apollo]|uniref:(apollo) hypothetical protein n=1 Tax=Parnassius apollo TaxID=110799 RepID=A0A8S3W3C6_PARAO|nr:unnamed protein product [Parnassius apollo]
MAATRKTLTKELVIKETCRDGYFTRMQRIFDLSKTINDAVIQDMFISQCETIDDIRSEYHKCIHDINSINIELDPEFTPEFNSWCSFEDLYFHVRRIKNKLCKPQTVNATKPKIALPKTLPNGACFMKHFIRR